METLVANLIGSVSRRHEQGQEYLVAPITLIVPGVLNGNQGPLYYPPEEVAASVDRWNEIPLTLGHPTKDGLPVSASDPSTVSLGFVRNSVITTSGKLQAEGWFSLKSLDPKILDSLSSGKPVPVSTGLFTDNELVAGASYKGKSYGHVAKNYRPDHLALLPGQVGACSIQDGCGVLVNAGGNLMGFTGRANGHIHGVNVSGGGDGIATRANDHLHMIENFKVRQVDGHKHSLDQKSLIDSGTRNKENLDMKKTELINSLITNSCCWVEEDRETLNDLSEKKLKSMVENVKEQDQLVANQKAAEAGFSDLTGNSHTFNPKTKKWETEVKEKEPMTNETGGLEVKLVAKKEPTFNELLEKAPAETRNAIRNAEKIVEREKAVLIGRLTSGVEDGGKEAVVNQLKTKSLEDLEVLMALAPAPKQDEAPVASYFGAAAGGSPVENRDFDENDILPLPIMELKEA